jgi:Ring finger domain
MDSTSKLGNFSDKNRFRKTLNYLLYLDTKSELSRYPKGYLHSVHMNSYLTLSLSRSVDYEVLILLRRISDQTILFFQPVTKLTDEKITSLIDNMIQRLNNMENVKKCLLCEESSYGHPYCQRCSLLETTYSENPCPICLDETRVTTVWRKLPCHHLFHDECVMKAAQEDQITCPMCRQPCDKKDAMIY